MEVSGRKGLGVKADDLITRMLQAAEARVRAEAGRDGRRWSLAKTANALAVGALRFFLLKYTRNTIIAFDFEDALKAEGETGPYCQYAVVRIRGIRRKGMEACERLVPVIATDSLAKFLEGPDRCGYLGVVVAEWFAGSCRGCCDWGAGAGVRGEICVPIGAGVQQFLPQAPHFVGDGRAEAGVFAGADGTGGDGDWCEALKMLGIETPEKM